MRGLQGNLQTAGFHTEALLAPEQALTLFFSRAQFQPRRTEIIPIEDTPGRVLAQIIVADRDYPATARSAMDGFALRSEETPGMLELAGEIAMGEMWTEALMPRHALRIPTGGALPREADTVVPVEDAECDGNRVRIAQRATAGDSVVPAGSDMHADETILQPGRLLGAPECGVLATLGITRVPVYCKPVIAILSSGNELVDVAADLQPAQVRDSNRWAIAAALVVMGASARHYPIVRDEPEQLQHSLRTAIAQCDAVITSGGSSVGRLDLLPHSVDLLHPQVKVHGLRVKPGKPTLLASVDGKPLIGLPGNPVSALIILETLGAPIVAQLTGAVVPSYGVGATLAEPIRKRIGWTHYVPVTLETSGGICTARPLQMRSAWASLLARASGFVTVSETTESLAAGEMVAVTRFLQGGHDPGR